jgi:hypothetical protein
MEDIITPENSSWSYVEEKIEVGYQLAQFCHHHGINPEDPQFSVQFVLNIIKSMLENKEKPVHPF